MYTCKKLERDMGYFFVDNLELLRHRSHDMVVQAAAIIIVLYLGLR